MGRILYDMRSAVTIRLDAVDTNVLVSASAIESRTDVLVTGDRDLLDIAAAAPIKLIDRRGFWDLVRKNG